MDHPMKNLIRTFTVYASLLSNSITFYLSSSTPETSEIVASLIFKNRALIALPEFKLFLLEIASNSIFQLFSAFPYFNCFVLVSIIRFLRVKNMDLREIVYWRKDELEKTVKKGFDLDQSAEVTERCLDYLLKILKIMK